jgi:hypothetical protein
VRTDAEFFLKLNGMMQQRHHLKFPVVQPKQRADTNIVASGLHRPVHGVKPP